MRAATIEGRCNYGRARRARRARVRQLKQAYREDRLTVGRDPGHAYDTERVAAAMIRCLRGPRRTGAPR